MNGPFRVIFLDYFGFKHEWIVIVNNTDEAIETIYKAYEYPIKEILDVYMDYKYVRNCPVEVVWLRIHHEVSCEIS